MTFDYGSWRSSVVEGPCKCSPDCAMTRPSTGDASGIRCLTPAVTVDLQQIQDRGGSDEEHQRRPAKRAPKQKAPLKHPGVRPSVKAYVEGAYLPTKSAKRGRRGGGASAVGPPSKGTKESAQSSFASEWVSMRRQLEEHAAFVEEITKDWVIVPMEKDGNCFFSALSKVLTGDVKDASNLRSRVVEHIRAEGERFNDFLGQDKEAYLQHMKAPKTFAGEMEIQAAEGLLGLRITVLSQTQASSESASKSLKEVFLLHHFAHFDLLWPKKAPMPGPNDIGPFYPTPDQVRGLSKGRGPVLRASGPQGKEVGPAVVGPPVPPGALSAPQERGSGDGKGVISQDDSAWNSVHPRKRRVEKQSERPQTQGFDRRVLDTRTTWGLLRCPAPAVVEGRHGYVEFLNPRSYTIRGWKDRFHSLCSLELPMVHPRDILPQG